MPYTQQRLYETVSAFMLMDKSREQCAELAKEVSSDYYWNTEAQNHWAEIEGKGQNPSYHRFLLGSFLTSIRTPYTAIQKSFSTITIIKRQGFSKRRIIEAY